MIRLVSDASIEEASLILKKGGLVAFPTETVYGLGANAFDPIAVAKIFEAKQRPSFDPLIVHVADADAARALWLSVPSEAEALMRAFWPGPLTIVLPKKESVPDIVTSGLATVGVRVPAHPAAAALLARSGLAIAAPSANPFGRTSPTEARHVEEDLGGAVDLILDGGRCAVGVESTVVEVVAGAARILRPGGVSAEEISKHIRLIAAPFMPGIGGEAGRSAPGMLESHYAPRTPMALVDRVPAERSGAFARAGLLTLVPRAEAAWFGAAEVLSAGGDTREAAANLFAAMRRLDAKRLDFIVAERVAPQGLGAAILDRLVKASSGKKLSDILPRA